MAVFNAASLTLTQGGNTYKFTPAVQLTYYGTCDTSASTQTKEITSSISTLISGLVLIVKFDNAQTYNGKPILKIGSVGSITVYNGYRYMWTAGAVVTFVYDGTRFYATNVGVASTTYYGVTKLVDSVASTSTALAATGKSVKTAYDAAVLVMTGATSSAAGTSGRVPAPASGDQDKVLTGAGTWAALPVMTGATSSAAGTSGYVPAPVKGAQNKVLAGSGSWITLPESGIVYMVDMGTVSSLPKTMSISGITTDMICVKAELGSPAAQMSDWTVNTNTANSITLSGTIYGSTTVKIYLQKMRELTSATAG